MQYFTNENNPDTMLDCARLMVEAVPLVMRTIRVESHRHAPADLSLPQLRTLGLLAIHPGISLCVLAEQLGLLPSSASKVVDQLVTRVLVTRQEDPADRRRAILTLTEDGKEMLHSSRQAILPYISERLATLSTDEQTTVAAAMSLLRKIFLPDRDAQLDPAADLETK